jgi:magnesium transporter
VIAHVFSRKHGDEGQGAVDLQTLSAADVQAGSVDVGACDLVWVDVAQAQADDIAWLEHTFGFHPLALEDVTLRHQRPKIDEYPGYYFVVLYAARVNAEAQRIVDDELQFFWGEKYLVTIHQEPFPEIDDLATRAKAGTLVPIVGATSRPLAVVDLVYRLVDAVVDGYFPAVDALIEWSEDLEQAMFSRPRSQETLRSIFALKKDLLRLRKTIAPSREVVNVLLRHDQALFGDEFFPYFQDVYDHTVRVIDSLDTYRDLLSSSLDTYLSIVSNDVNQTVKQMTAVTAILMVSALIASIYGMNFDVMPELHWHYGYGWALGLMAGASILLWLLFRRIRWF